MGNGGGSLRKTGNESVEKMKLNEKSGRQERCEGHGGQWRRNGSRGVVGMSQERQGF